MSERGRDYLGAAETLSFTRRMGAALDRCDAANLPLSSAIDIRREQAKVYRELRNGDLDMRLAAKLVWVLGELRQSLVAEELEARIAALEKETTNTRKDAR